MGNFGIEAKGRDFREIDHHLSRDGNTPLGHILVSGFLLDHLGVPANPMRVLGNYALVYLLEGSGFYEDGNGYQQKVGAGDLLILYPEIPHICEPSAGGNWNDFYVVFRGPAFDFWRKVGLLDPAQPIRHLQPIDSWLSRFQEAAQAAWSAEAAERTLEISRFLSLLTELLAVEIPKSTEPAGQNWLERARFYLGAGLNEELNLEQLARRIGVSYESFRKRFQQQTGVSPARYRMMRRIEAACDLLLYTSMTNQQVAESVGFWDEYYFYKRFKQMVGKTPRAFRKSPP
ncbi:MAG TPA: AraC family transcriptional regulator [Chthonomonadaceae bacterium]|nr:AraC family transcriptional regulator [Chthonomonadaceae bacterium]